VGQWQWNGWLTAKGRVVALFALLRTGEEAFRLVLPDFPADELRVALMRFVFRSKVRLAVESTLACAGALEAPPASGNGERDQATDADGAWALDVGGDTLARTLWLLPQDDCGDADPRLDAAWHRADLRHGLPRLGPAQREAWTPQMLSLQRLRAYSVKKGCYPGQEIVARTHFLGHAKRGLALVAGADLAEGMAVTTDPAGAAIGSLACVDAAGTLALAVVSLESADQSLVVGTSAVERMPLDEGLQRPA